MHCTKIAEGCRTWKEVFEKLPGLLFIVRHLFLRALHHLLRKQHLVQDVNVCRNAPLAQQVVQLHRHKPLDRIIKRRHKELTNDAKAAVQQWRVAARPEHRPHLRAHPDGCVCVRACVRACVCGYVSVGA